MRLRKLILTLSVGVILLASCAAPSVAPTPPAPPTPTPTPTPDLITVDGLVDDWEGLDPAGYDDIGDSTLNSGTDIVSYFTYTDSSGLCVLVNFMGYVCQEDSSYHYQINLDTDMDMEWDRFISFRCNREHRLRTSEGSIESNVSFAFGEKQLEVVIPWGDIPDFQIARIGIVVWDRINEECADYAGYEIIRGRKQFTEDQQDRISAKSLEEHRSCWNYILERAAGGDEYAKYAFYAARIIAVKSPEIYLIADNCFITDIESRKTYSFELTRKKYESYRTIKQSEFYPKEFPQHAFLDRRIMPASSTLVNVRDFLTPINKGILEFLVQKKKNDPEDMFIIYCDNENTYLYNGGVLTDMATLETVKDIGGKPILIFNELNTWFPLMGRDDTAINSRLANVVRRYAKTTTLKLSDEESIIIEKLKEITALNSGHEKATALMSSIGAITLPSSKAYYTEVGAWPDTKEEFLIRMRSDLLSPAASYLIGVMSQFEGIPKLAMLSAFYRELTSEKRHPERTPYDWLDIWNFERGEGSEYGLEVYHNLDQSYYAHLGSDLEKLQTLKAILSYKGFKSYIYFTGTKMFESSGFQGGYGGLPLILPDYDVRFEGAGNTRIRKSAIYYDPGDSRATREANSIALIFTFDEFAHIVIGEYLGSMSPQESLEFVDHLRNLYNEQLWFVKKTELGYEVASYSELANYLQSVDWQEPKMPP